MTPPEWSRRGRGQVAVRSASRPGARRLGDAFPHVGRVRLGVAEEGRPPTRVEGAEEGLATAEPLREWNGTASSPRDLRDDLPNHIGHHARGLGSGDDPLQRRFQFVHLRPVERSPRVLVPTPRPEIGQVQLAHSRCGDFEPYRPGIHDPPGRAREGRVEPRSDVQRLAVVALELRHELVVATESRVPRAQRLGLMDEQLGPRRCRGRPGGQHIAGGPEMGEQEAAQEQVGRPNRERRRGDVMDLVMRRVANTSAILWRSP